MLGDSIMDVYLKDDNEVFTNNISFFSIQLFSTFSILICSLIYIIILFHFLNSHLSSYSWSCFLHIFELCLCHSTNYWFICNVILWLESFTCGYWSIFYFKCFQVLISITGWHGQVMVIRVSLCNMDRNNQY